jgi:hypothetical protein
MTERSDRLRFAGSVLALVGWAFGAVTFLVLLADNHFEVGADLAAYLRAGDSLVAGEPVYIGEIGQFGVFSYAPPWAVLFGALLLTLPWLHLWPEWIEHLLRQPSSIDIHIGPPWYVRLPFALALLLVRRPWAPGVAVVVGMPSLWLGTLVILIAPIRLWFDGRRAS